MPAWPARLPIRQLVHEGDRLIVQGVREAAGDKGARVTSDLKLFGFALVYSPVGEVVEPVQQPGRRHAEALRLRAQELFPDGRFFAATRPSCRTTPSWPRRRSWPSGGGGWRLDPERSSPAGCRSRTALQRLLRGLVDLGRTIEIADRCCWRWSCGPRVPPAAIRAGAAGPGRAGLRADGGRWRAGGRAGSGCRWLGAAGC